MSEPLHATLAGTRPGPRGFWRGLAWRLRAARSLRRERRALSELNPAALRDVGLSAAAAEREARRPFWDAPDHWRLR